MVINPTPQQETTVNEYINAFDQVSQAYLSGISEAYKNIQDTWKTEITPLEKKMSDLVAANTDAARQAASKAIKQQGSGLDSRIYYH